MATRTELEAELQTQHQLRNITSHTKNESITYKVNCSCGKTTAPRHGHGEAVEVWLDHVDDEVNATLKYYDLGYAAGLSTREGAHHAR